MIGLDEKRAEAIPCSMNSGLHGDTGHPRALSPQVLRAWKTGLLEELNESPVRRRLSLALAGVACIHLAIFVLCQAISAPEIRQDMRHPALWLIELIAVLLFLNRSLGRGWYRSTTAMTLVAKLWTTFLIISFNAVTLNALTGFDLYWYRPVWASLSTFFLASLAWLFTPWFLIPAVQMWVTGLLLVHLPDWGFLVYGVSWWIALLGIAVVLGRKQPGVQE